MVRMAHPIGLLIKRILLKQAKMGRSVWHYLLATLAEERLSIRDLVLSGVPLVVDNLLNDVAS